MGTTSRSFLLLAALLRGFCIADEPPSCNYLAGSDSQGMSPFIYYQRLANGSVAEVQPQADPDTGLCVYSEASCEAAGSFECCKERKEYKTVLGSLNPATLNNLVNNAVVVLPLYLYSFYRRCRARRLAARDEDESAAGEKCSLWKFVAGIALLVAIAADVFLMVTMADMTQSLLSVPIRNAMLAAGVFLTPIREVFQFLEDAVSVKVNLAIGAEDVPATRQILLLGVLGGAGLGSAAAALVTLLCYIAPAIEVLLAPYSLHGGADGCSLVPSASEVVSLARPYVLLTAWSWPFAFANMALRGFLLGVGEWTSFCALAMLEQGIGIVGLFVFFASDPKIETLGWIPFIGSSFATVFMVSSMYCRRQIRDKYMPMPWRRSPAVKELVKPADAEAQTTSTPAVDAMVGMSVGLNASWSALLRDGMAAMVADLAVQIPATVGTYLTGVTMGIGPMYQISALQAALPQYGISWVQGLGFYFRIKGSSLLGQRDFQGFARFFKVAVFYVTMLAASSLATTAPFARQISVDLAAQACEYAAEPRCLPMYGSIFGGLREGDADTLQGSSFKAFVPALCAVCFFRVFKAGLYACQDFRFMAKAGSVVLVLVFVPSVIVAGCVGSPTVVFIAMYLPCLFLACIFAVRIRSNIKKMQEGREGPWSVRSASASAPSA